jgi:ParB-like chromosome segregation protein Spo0J
MQIIKIKVADLSNDPANARKHDDRNIESIVASLRRFGQQKPIVVDMNNIVRAGNGTLEAARRLGWDSIDCVKTDLKGSDAIAYAIADNRTSELAEWNSDVLAAQLNGLLADDEELANAAGFTAEEIEAMGLIDEESSESESDGKLSQSLQLEPGKEYILITFSDAIEFDEAKETLGLELVRRGGYKDGSPFDAVSTERVLTWDRVKGLLV